MKGKQNKERTKILNARRPKEDEYVIKSNALAKILRVVFWGMLLFIFARGVITSLQPTDEEGLRRTMANFKEEFATYKGENEEVMAFAQNFVREYLTYSTKGAEEYKSRLQPYISSRINNLQDITDYSGSATVNYVQAYRKEQYAPNQYDVYVIADVSYSMLQTEDDITTTITTIKPTYLKVPVFAGSGAYIIEDLPIFVSDSLLKGNYSPKSISLSRASDAEVADIKTALLNFLTAYYGAEQSVIDYYLHQDAEKSTFWGLDGRYSFDRLDSLNVYTLSNNEYLCVAGIFIRDGINNARLYQEYNLHLQAEGTRYYIKDLNTKTINLKF